MNSDRLSYRKFRALTIDQPIGRYYSCVMPWDFLVKIGEAKIRELKSEIEEYIGIQRPLNKDRVKEIRQYVRTVDSTFPNSIIININTYEEKNNEIFLHDTNNGIKQIKIIETGGNNTHIEILDKENIARIIDGQHRLAGFEEKFEGTFDLIVTIFVDMDIEEQAMLFSIINSKHRKVDPSLAYDLYEFVNSRSPIKTCHNLAKIFNSGESSPWYRKLKMLGRKTTYYKGVLSQKTFIDQILQYISENPMNDWDLIKRKKINVLKSESYNSYKLIFRKYFLEDEDEYIYKILLNYFTSMKKTWPEEWESDKYILTKTTGYIAFMRAFRKIYLEGRSKKDLSQAFFDSKMSIVKDKLNKLTSTNYESGSQGQNRLRDEILGALS